MSLEIVIISSLLFLLLAIGLYLAGYKKEAYLIRDGIYLAIPVYILLILVM